MRKGLTASLKQEKLRSYKDLLNKPKNMVTEQV